MGIATRVADAVSKRLAAHARERAEDFLLPRREFEQLRLSGTSALTIVCDDGEVKDLEVVEVLEREGVRGVFAVSPDLIGRPGFLGYAQLRQIRAAGHEIAFHGTTHDPFSEFADMGQLRRAIDDGVARMADEGLGTPRTLIYPFGRNNRAVRQVVSDVFASAFTTWFGINPGRANRYAIHRIPFGAYTGTLPATEEWYSQLVERAATRGCWPTLMLHPAANGHGPEHNALLGRLITHAREQGLAVRTAAAHLATLAPAAGRSVMCTGARP